MLNKQLSSLSKHLREQARKNEELENLVTDLQRQMANFRYGGHAEQAASDDSLHQFGSRDLLFFFGGGGGHMLMTFRKSLGKPYLGNGGSSGLLL